MYVYLNYRTKILVQVDCMYPMHAFVKQMSIILDVSFALIMYFYYVNHFLNNFRGYLL